MPEGSAPPRLIADIRPRKEQRSDPRQRAERAGLDHLDRLGPTNRPRLIRKSLPMIERDDVRVERIGPAVSKKSRAGRIPRQHFAPSASAR